MNKLRDKKRILRYVDLLTCIPRSTTEPRLILLVLGSTLPLSNYQIPMSILHSANYLLLSNLSKSKISVNRCNPLLPRSRYPSRLSKPSKLHSILVQSFYHSSYLCLERRPTKAKSTKEYTF